MVKRLIPAQIRGARGLLGWSMVDLAQAAKVSISTVKRAESEGGVAPSKDILGVVRGALEANGIRFSEEQSSFGVHLLRVRPGGPAAAPELT